MGTSRICQKQKKNLYINNVTMSDSCKNSPDMMTDSGTSRAISPTFRSSLAMAPLPALSTPTLEKNHGQDKKKVEREMR